MKQIKIEVEKLVPIIKANLATHIVEYNEACANYHKLCLKTLKDELKIVNKKDSIDPVSLSIHIEAPMSHAKEYTSILRQLELSSEPIVTLDANEFSQYVEDEWVWKNHFAASNSYYAASVR